MMGENGVPNAALSPSSVLCLFPNVDMFSGAMRRQQQETEEEAASRQEQRPPQEVLRGLRPQGWTESSHKSQTLINEHAKTVPSLILEASEVLSSTVPKG